MQPLQPSSEQSLVSLHFEHLLVWLVANFRKGINELLGWWRSHEARLLNRLKHLGQDVNLCYPLINRCWAISYLSKKRLHKSCINLRVVTNLKDRVNTSDNSFHHLFASRVYHLLRYHDINNPILLFAHLLFRYILSHNFDKLPFFDDCKFDFAVWVFLKLINCDIHF